MRLLSSAPSANQQRPEPADGSPIAIPWSVPEVSEKDILKTIGSALGKTKLMLPAGAMITAPIAGLLGRFRSFPVSRGHVTMLQTGNACADDKPRRLDIEPHRFDKAALGYPAGSGPARLFDPK